MLIIDRAQAFSCCTVKNYGVRVLIWIQLSQAEWVVLGNKVVIIHLLLIGSESYDHLSDYQHLNEDSAACS
jgi:hypothetical protein